MDRDKIHEVKEGVMYVRKGEKQIKRIRKTI